MYILLILLSVVLSQCESVTIKEYARRHGSGGMFFSGVICFFALIFFVVTDKGGFYFPNKLFYFGLANCVCYATGFYAMYMALRLGSLANTKLISSLTGVVTIAYGILVFDEPVGRFTYPAIGLVFLSIFLMNYKKGDGTFSIKWLFWSLMVVVSNSPIGILKREQQLFFNGKCDNEYMIITLVGASLFLLVMSAFKERDNITVIFKKGIVYGALAGILNGAGNFLNLFIYSFVPLSLASPISSASALVLSFLISSFIYKEKFSKRQIVAAVIGTASVVLFKIS